jgi:orotate phosphoribosyltransferase-like protein
MIARTLHERGQVRVLWDQGLDTVDIAKELHTDEPTAEHFLHKALDLKAEVRASLRASVNSLCGND